jgi:hypothetical protein
VPRGWEIPTNAKKLKVGVVISGGYKKYIDAKEDSSTGLIKTSGLAIDSFEEAVQRLPYPFPYEYVVFDREFPGKLAPAITRSHTGSLTRQRKHEVRLLREFLVRRTRQLPVLLLYSIKQTTGHKLNSCRETWTTRAILPPPHDAHGLHTHRGLARA